MVKSLYFCFLQFPHVGCPKRSMTSDKAPFSYLDKLCVVASTPSLKRNLGGIFLHLPKECFLKTGPPPLLGEWKKALLSLLKAGQGTWRCRQWRIRVWVFCFSPPVLCSSRRLYVTDEAAARQMSLHPLTWLDGYMDMIQKSSTFRCNVLRNCYETLRKMAIWSDLPSEKSYGLGHAWFLEMDKAEDRQLTCCCLSETNRMKRGKDLQPREDREGKSKGFTIPFDDRLDRGHNMQSGV